VLLAPVIAPVCAWRKYVLLSGGVLETPGSITKKSITNEPMIRTMEIRGVAAIVGGMDVCMCVCVCVCGLCMLCAKKRTSVNPSANRSPMIVFAVSWCTISRDLRLGNPRAAVKLTGGELANVVLFAGERGRKEIAEREDIGISKKANFKKECEILNK
jgi:hypothetical protein